MSTFADLAISQHQAASFMTSLHIYTTVSVGIACNISFGNISDMACKLHILSYDLLIFYSRSSRPNPVARVHPMVVVVDENWKSPTEKEFICMIDFHYFYKRAALLFLEHINCHACYCSVKESIENGKIAHYKSRFLSAAMD